MNQLMPHRMPTLLQQVFLLVLAHTPLGVLARRRRKKYSKPDKHWWLAIAIVGAILGFIFLVLIIGYSIKWYNNRKWEERRLRGVEAMAILQREREEARASNPEMQSLQQSYTRDQEEEYPPAPPYTPAACNGDKVLASQA